MNDTHRPGPGVDPQQDEASMDELPTPHSPHRRAWDAIPWVVAGSASAAERAHVESHAAGCAECRAEIEFHTAVRDGLRGPEAAMADVAPTATADTSDDTAADAAWSLMRQRLDAEAELDTETVGARAPGPGLRPSHRRSGQPAANGPWRWLVGAGAAALVLQAIGLAVLSAALWGRSGVDAPYQVLSESSGDIAATLRSGDAVMAPRAHGVRLVLAPAATMGELQAGLAAMGWKLAEVSGDARLLVVVPGPQATLSPEQAMAALRAWPHTLLVEPMPAATTPSR